MCVQSRVYVEQDFLTIHFYQINDNSIFNKKLFQPINNPIVTYMRKAISEKLSSPQPHFLIFLHCISF